MYRRGYKRRRRICSCSWQKDGDRERYELVCRSGRREAGRRRVPGEVLPKTMETIWAGGAVVIRMKLAQKFGLLVTGVIALALLTSVVAVWSSLRLGAELRATFEHSLPSVRAAEELEISLLEQRGLVKAFILDNGDRSWLDGLHAPKANFAYWFNQARTTAQTDREHQILDQLGQAFREYDAKREQVLVLYETGQADQAKEMLLRDVTHEFRNCSELCKEFIAANVQLIERRAAESRNQTRWAMGIVVFCVACTAGLGGLFLWLLVAGVLLPLRRMAADAREVTGLSSGAGDELATIGAHLRNLMSDVTDTRSSLEQSRNRLANAEKLAVVGKLAAGVAHEIRNPLTAVKMWLFSLQRNLNGDLETNHAFGLISAEILRLENIIKNFLEFARPPRLKILRELLPPLIDDALEFLTPRLDERRIALSWEPPADLPPALIDADQFRQVLMNLLVNALEVTPPGSRISIAAQAESDGKGGPVLVVRIRDSGPGIPDEVRARIFEPFFTTKDDGTGLGLSVAARIMGDHGGRLLLESTGGAGTAFAVWVPVAPQEPST
ncbi:MAG: hypothetical protein EA424_15500 [Planctomycetaceae bacterium]|nr:MAG: hypothetical protein EA424_15500 [Planctomycetaceae bacterium]